MGTLALSGTCLSKCGNNVNRTMWGISGQALWDEFIRQAEGEVNVTTLTNWTDDYAGLDADTKYILEGIVSNMAAIYGILWDMSGYTSRSEAESMINTLRDAANRGMNTLKDQKARDAV